MTHKITSEFQNYRENHFYATYVEFLTFQCSFSTLPRGQFFCKQGKVSKNILRLMLTGLKLKEFFGFEVNGFEKFLLVWEFG